MPLAELSLRRCFLSALSFKHIGMVSEYLLPIFKRNGRA